VESGSEPLSKFMQGLQQSYTQYFNRKHHKIGHLFQGEFVGVGYAKRMTKHEAMKKQAARLTKHCQE
jgi:hypothetical protein